MLCLTAILFSVLTETICELGWRSRQSSLHRKLRKVGQNGRRSLDDELQWPSLCFYLTQLKDTELEARQSWTTKSSEVNKQQQRGWNFFYVVTVSFHPPNRQMMDSTITQTVFYCYMKCKGTTPELLPLMLIKNCSHSKLQMLYQQGLNDYCSNLHTERIPKYLKCQSDHRPYKMSSEWCKTSTKRCRRWDIEVVEAISLA